MKSWIQLPFSDVSSHVSKRLTDLGTNGLARPGDFLWCIRSKVVFQSVSAIYMIVLIMARKFLVNLHYFLLYETRMA